MKPGGDPRPPEGKVTRLMTGKLGIKGDRVKLAVPKGHQKDSLGGPDKVSRRGRSGAQELYSWGVRGAENSQEGRRMARLDDANQGLWEKTNHSKQVGKGVLSKQLGRDGT